MYIHPYRIFSKAGQDDERYIYIELARASMTTSDVNNQWRSNFQQQII
jgi:hypothetical protein